jgi:hypothetical protein
MWEFLDFAPCLMRTVYKSCRIGILALIAAIPLNDVASCVRERESSSWRNHAHDKLSPHRNGAGSR